MEVQCLLQGFGIVVLARRQREQTGCATDKQQKLYSGRHGAVLLLELIALDSVRIDARLPLHGGQRSLILVLQHSPF